ncbi:hypothetical protein GC207_13685 [bacterium]|nr:hypothetical protein [bacterium]
MNKDVSKETGDGESAGNPSRRTKALDSNTVQRRERLAAGEAEFLDALVKFARGARRSQVPEIAVAARRWEGRIHFHIQITRQKRKAGAERRRPAKGDGI